MKLYVDKMPKCCSECEHCTKNHDGCNGIPYCLIARMPLYNGEDINFGRGQHVGGLSDFDCPLKLLPTQMSLPNDKDINVPSKNVSDTNVGEIEVVNAKTATITDTEKNSATDTCFQNGNNSDSCNRFQNGNSWKEKWEKLKDYIDTFFMEKLGCYPIPIAMVRDKMQQLENEEN